MGLLLRAGIILLLSFCLFQCSDGLRTGNYGTYSDNLESLKGEDNKISGRNERFRVGDLPQVNRDTVRSGKNSLRLDPAFPYGMNYQLPGVRTDEYVEASVWYSGPGQVVLVASHKDAKYFYRKSGSIPTPGEEWRELKLSLSVPPSMDKEDLNIYVWNPGKEPVYLDDFEISYSEFRSYPVYRDDESIHFLVDTLDMLSLEQKRNEAFAKGILETEDDDFVPGIMYYRDSIMPVELRLKGDWLDHLEGRKWSFRVKVMKQNTWHNMLAFSIHTPFARDFLNEHVSHRLFRKSGLLAPRYGFVPVTLNGTSLGIYAWEEHFEKQLVESASRREGPILKFEEGLFWLSQKVYLQDAQYFELPFLEASDIMPFKLNRTLKDPGLRQSFMLGNNLMNHYRQGLKPPSEVFDIDKLAGYFALMDLTRGFHGIAWHNQRFYYNPVLCRLEPIFFDAYTEAGVFTPERNAISGFFDFDAEPVKRFENLVWVRLFQDEKFIGEYIKWLEKVSDPVWINDFLQEEEKSISAFEKMIREEFNSYSYDRGFLLENAKRIRFELPEYKQHVSENPEYAHFDEDKIKYIDYNRNYDPRFPEYYVNAYLQDSTEIENIIRIDNIYPLEIELTGYGTGKRGPMGGFRDVIPVPAFEKRFPASKSVFVPRGSKYVYFNVKGHDDRLAVEIMPFPSPGDYTPEQELFLEAGPPDLPFVNTVNGTITFIKGQHIVNEPVIIPAGYNVIFEAGCEIDFRSGSMFISKSPLQMTGTVTDQVIIKSTDNTANGFTVLQAGNPSVLKNVIFEGLNTLNYKGWMLTGAVNFYESNVEIDEVQFNSNVCEDGLNIIRSDFIVTNSYFNNTFSDAFDSDFCTGLVRNVSFVDSGNDAIDFSGSVVDIIDCTIINAMDKGVSSGEGSTLSVSNTSVQGAVIGYASKDNSILNLDNCSAANVQYGLAAFQKKPEYGPGHIKAGGFKAEGFDELYIVETFSTLHLNGTIVIGEATKVYDLFY